MKNPLNKKLLHKIYWTVRYTINDYKKWFVKFKTSRTVPFKLDVHAVEHCNLNCKGCSHYSPVAEPKYLDAEELERNLRKLSKFQSSFYAFQILGGEPLLHPHLAEIMDVSRRCFDKLRITLMTNGILLLNEEKLPPLFWESCKKNDIIIRITKYPVDIDYVAIEKKMVQKGIKYEMYRDRSEINQWAKYQLHETDIRSKIDRLKIFRHKYCKSQNCLQLVGNKIFPCHLSAYIDHLNKAFNRKFEISEKDYVVIDDLKNIKPLRRLLNYSVPFCRYCGSGFEVVEWNRSKKEIEEWIDFKDDKKE